MCASEGLMTEPIPPCTCAQGGWRQTWRLLLLELDLDLEALEARTVVLI